MPILMLILTACSNAYAMSWLLSTTQAIVDGGSTNRFWVVVSQSALLKLCLSPLYLMFPAATVAMSFIFYSSLAFLAGLNYAASICHLNQDMAKEKAVPEQDSWLAPKNKTIQEALTGLSIFSRVTENVPPRDKVKVRGMCC